MCEFLDIFDISDYNKLFDIITIGVCVINPNTSKLVYINDYSLQLLDLNKQHIYDNDIQYIDYINNIYKKYQFKSINNKLNSFEINLRRIKGQNRITLKITYLINKEYLVLFITDITSIKNYQQQLYDKNKILAKTNIELKESNKLLEEMAYMMAHDLRSPIRTISGYIQKLIDSLQKDYKLNDTLVMYSDFIVESTTHINELIDGLLIYSNITGKNLNVESNILNECITSALSKINKCKSIIVNNNVDNTITIKTNKILFVKVLIHLFENAIKFNNKKQKQIDIDYNINTCILTIKDNGNGIESEYLDKIFKLFYQLDNDINGVGLGLSIVQRILNIHDCYIYVKSEVEVGSEFCINIKKIVSNG